MLIQFIKPLSLQRHGIQMKRNEMSILASLRVVIERNADETYHCQLLCYRLAFFVNLPRW